MQTRCNTCLKEFQDSDIVCGYEHYDFDNKYRPDGLQKPNSVHLIHEHCLGKQAPNVLVAIKNMTFIVEQVGIVK